MSQHRGPILGADQERCIYCAGRITRKGKRYKKLETIQLWYCHTCNRVFTPQITKGKTYPLKVILEALKLYYRGHSIPDTLNRLKKRYGLTVAPRSLTSWLTEHRPLADRKNKAPFPPAPPPLRPWRQLSCHVPRARDGMVVPRRRGRGRAPLPCGIRVAL